MPPWLFETWPNVAQGALLLLAVGAAVALTKDETRRADREQTVSHDTAAALAQLEKGQQMQHPAEHTAQERHERLRVALACTRLAAHLYERLRRDTGLLGDRRLRPALAAIAGSLDTSAPADRGRLVETLRVVESAPYRDIAEGAAAGAVADMGKVTLAHADGQPWPVVNVAAGLVCFRAMEAYKLARDLVPDAATLSELLEALDTPEHTAAMQDAVRLWATPTTPPEEARNHDHTTR